MPRILHIEPNGSTVNGRRTLSVTVGRSGPQGPAGSGGGGGVSDHGALTGLADDDHPQYLTNTRGDLRYDDRGQDSAGTGLFAFTDFSRATAGTIHDQQSTGSALGDPRTWIDGRTAGGSGIDAFVEVAHVVSGVLRHRGTRLSAAAAYSIPAATARTQTAGYVADTAGPGTDGPSFVRLGFLDTTGNGYLGYLKAPTSTANHELLIVRDDLGVPTAIAGPFDLGRRLTAADRWSFAHDGNTFAVYLNGDEVGRVTETTYAASTFDTAVIVLSSEDATNAPIGASLPGIPWHALSVGSPIVTPSGIGAVPTSRTITAGTGLTGGGDLSANRTLSVSYGTTAGTAAEGNHTHAASAITSGTLATDRLGSGTANSTTFLRGDQTWAAPTVSSIAASAITSGTLATARLALPVRRFPGAASYSSMSDHGVPPTDIVTTTTGTVATGTMRLAPCDIVGGPTLATIVLEVTATALTAGQQVTIGCYARASTGLPTGSALWSHTVTVGTTTGIYNVATTNSLPEGGCYLAVLNPSGNAGTVTIRLYQPVGPYLLATGTVNNRAGLISHTGLSALPDLSAYTLSSSAATNVLATNQNAPLLLLR